MAIGFIIGLLIGMAIGFCLGSGWVLIDRGLSSKSWGKEKIEEARAIRWGDGEIYSKASYG